jgi:hypothetical protein
MSECLEKNKKLKRKWTEPHPSGPCGPYRGQDLRFFPECNGKAGRIIIIIIIIIIMCVHVHIGRKERR